MNEGDCAGETALVVAPVEATRAKILTLLDEWPDHPLLAQLLEICDRVLALPLMGPVKQALTGLELLLARAQTWEEGAASAASLREELARCAELALRWRRRELRTWPRLLARASERHVARANRTWFALHRLLRPPPRSGVGEEAECEKKREEDNTVDARAADERTSERSSGAKINYAGVDASGLTAEEREGLRQVTLALEEYVQASTIGEFRARLDLLWQFHADADVEARTRRREEGPAGGGDGSGVSGGGARERQLSNVLYNTWRYYAQFAPVVSRKVEAARAPAAQKLRDHARLAKWEDRGYHAMKTSGEANQRSLHKFVRAFDQSLNALALPALEAAAGATGLGDLPSERADAELAGAEAARRANEREQRRLAIEAKVRMRAEAKAAHAAASAGATRGESKADKAQREADALDARKTLEKELAEASRRVVREAELAAVREAEEAAERGREEVRVARRARWAARADRARKDAEAARKLLADARRDAEKSVAEDEEKRARDRSPPRSRRFASTTRLCTSQSSSRSRGASARSSARLFPARRRRPRNAPPPTPRRRRRRTRATWTISRRRWRRARRRCDATRARRRRRRRRRSRICSGRSRNSACGRRGGPSRTRRESPRRGSANPPFSRRTVSDDNTTRRRATNCRRRN